MRKALLALGLLVLAGTGWWVYRNASIERLRGEFRPWMARLERWRDANEALRRSVRSRETTATDPDGVAALREWAWAGLDRLGYVDYRVEKPRHDGEATTGPVTFTIGGFRSDGTRVERAASATVTEAGGRYTVRFEKPLWERVEATPRFRNVTSDAGLGAPRHDPPIPKTNRLISDIWPGSGIAVLDFDGDGHEDLFVGDGVRSILYKGDGAGRFVDVTEAAGLAQSRDAGVPGTGLAAGDVDGDGFPDLAVTNAFAPTRLFRNRGDGTFEETTAASGIAVPENARSAGFADVDRDGDLDLYVAVTGDYYSQMPDPAFDAKDGRRNFLYLNDGRGHFTDVT
ncbi:MAG: VCBS repeat-containing protein, partial [Thermoanaerobaculia bacterium]